LLQILGAGPDYVQQHLFGIHAALGADSPGMGGIADLVASFWDDRPPPRRRGRDDGRRNAAVEDTTKRLDCALDSLDSEAAKMWRTVFTTQIGTAADQGRAAFYVEPHGIDGSRVRWLDEEERFELGADLDLAGAEGGR
jgi:hypothetical protein